MNSEKGLDIKLALTRQQRTQRWLLDELKKRGYKTVDRPLLSRILSGHYPYRLGREILAVADVILKQDREAQQEAI